MTKHQFVMEVQEWLTSPNKAIELYKRGEPTFEVGATSKKISTGSKVFLCQLLILSC